MFRSRYLPAIVLSILLLGGVQPAMATSVLYFTDFDLGTNAVPGALALLGLSGSTTTATDTSNFNTLLGSGSWDLAIVCHQNAGSTDDNVAAALQAYISGGGKVLATTWQNDLFPPLFDASYAGANASLITADAHPIFLGVGPTISLANPGWGVFSMSWDPTGGAQGIGSLGTGSALILGNGGQTILQGPLFDTFSSLPQGQQFVANEINFLLGQGGGVVPEPLTMLAIPVALTGLAGYIRRSRR